MYPPNLQSVAFSVPEIIVIAVFGWGCEPLILGKGRPWGSRMVPFERAFVTSYRLSVVTFNLSLCVSEKLPLLCSKTPLFPTTPLVSPKFPRVLLDGLWATKSEGVALIVHSISF